MTVTYTLHNKDEVKSGEIVMKKSSFSGGDPIVSKVWSAEFADAVTSQVTIANMCNKDARSLLKLVGQIWTGVKVYVNNESGEIRVCIPNVENPKKQDKQKDKTFDHMVTSIKHQNNMFGVIASVEFFLCGDMECKKCAFCCPISEKRNDCLALKYTNYRDKVRQAFEKMNKQGGN